MRTVKTRGETHAEFAKPSNWDDSDGVCNSLSARVGPYGARSLLEVVSTWKPDAADLAHLNRGGVIELSSIGGMCPSAMSVVDPVEPPAPAAYIGGHTASAWQCFDFPDQGVSRVYGPNGIVLVYSDSELAASHCRVLKAALEREAPAAAETGGPAITINEHAHGDDSHGL